MAQLTPTSVSQGSNPFAIDPDSELPVGVQLTWRLRALILTGRLSAGEPLPSVRRLATWAGVNPNTVRSVYDALEKDGLVVSQQGRGTFVSASAAPDPGLESIALQALGQGQDSGRDPRELAMVVMACASMLDLDEKVSPPVEDADFHEPPDGETIEVRQELRRQIARLEGELSAYVRDLAADDLATAPLRAEAHIAGVEELEQTRDTLIAKLSKAQKAAEARARREGEARRSKGEAGSIGPLGRAIGWWRESQTSAESSS